MSEKNYATELYYPTDIRLDREACAKLYESTDEDLAEELDDLVEEAKEIARPVAIYRVTEAICTEEGAEVGGIAIDSPFVAEKLRGAEKVIAYVVTSGMELEEWSAGYADDPLAGFWADELKKIVLGQAFLAFQKLAETLIGLPEGKYLSALNPGSLNQWPISGQKQLFAILDGEETVKERAGVILRESMLMFPSKTGSGIYFITDEKYHNCMLCPRRNTCPNSRV